jgi:hypothetical protein
MPQCDNLIPGTAAAYRWAVESGELVHTSTFEHVATCVYMSYRPNESYVCGRTTPGVEASAVKVAASVGCVCEATLSG